LESKELIVKKKNYGYQILSIVFVISVVGSMIFFSNANSHSNDIMKKEKVISYSGEHAGEIIFGREGEIALSPQNNNMQKKLSNQSEETDIEQRENKEMISNNHDLVQYDVESSGKDAENYFATNRKLDKNKPMVALTFDDGPDPVRTQKIIDILQKYHSRATFFDIGNLMEKYPTVLKAEFDSGCDVGGHTYSHTNLNNLSKEEIEEEMNKMEKVFRNVTGNNLKYIRPTYGNANELVRTTVKHPLINWCIDSLDWKTRDKEKILEEIYQTEDFDGKIVIMHVIYDATVEAVEELIPDLINKGYQLVTISEMAEYKDCILENGKVYYQF